VSRRSDLVSLGHLGQHHVLRAGDGVKLAAGSSIKDPVVDGKAVFVAELRRDLLRLSATLRQAMDPLPREHVDMRGVDGDLVGVVDPVGQNLWRASGCRKCRQGLLRRPVTSPEQPRQPRLPVINTRPARIRSTGNIGEM